MQATCNTYSVCSITAGTKSNSTLGYLVQNQQVQNPPAVMTYIGNRTPYFKGVHKRKDLKRFMRIKKQCSPACILPVYCVVLLTCQRASHKRIHCSGGEKGYWLSGLSRKTSHDSLLKH